jgi:ABC-type polysaccharide transport system permease subunit
VGRIQCPSFYFYTELSQTFFEQYLSDFSAQSSVLVRHRRDYSCRIRCARCVCFVSAAARLEVYEGCFYGAERHFGSCVGAHYKFIFNNDMGILNHLIRIFNPGFQVQWYYQSPYAFWAITLTWLFYAVIVTLLVMNDLLAIPAELFEAAGLDGASGWQIVTKIQLPLCRYSIGTGVICAITSRVAMYEQIVFTTAGGPGDDTMNLPLILVQAINNMKYGYANAVSVVMVILGLLVLALVNKLFRMNESVY